MLLLYYILILNLDFYFVYYEIGFKIAISTFLISFFILQHYKTGSERKNYQFRNLKNSFVLSILSFYIYVVIGDDIRDSIKGHYSDISDRGFVTGKRGCEETIKIGIVAATAHPQVDYRKGNNSKFPYAKSPQEVINYVSCHDDYTLTDKRAFSI